jgi:hypothetical protein
MMKNTRNIILASIITIVVFVLLYFAEPAPGKGKSYELLRLVFLSSLAAVIPLFIIVKYIKFIIRFAIANLPLVIAVLVAGLLISLLIFIDWPLEIAMKVELLRCVLITSLTLVGFAYIILIELARGRGDFDKEHLISGARIRPPRIFICFSMVLGSFAILASIVYFVIFDRNVIYLAWILFIMQLVLLILSLIFARIITLR